MLVATEMPREAQLKRIEKKRRQPLEVWPEVPYEEMEVGKVYRMDRTGNLAKWTHLHGALECAHVTRHALEVRETVFNCRSVHPRFVDFVVGAELPPEVVTVAERPVFFCFVGIDVARWPLPRNESRAAWRHAPKSMRLSTRGLDLPESMMCCI